MNRCRVCKGVVSVLATTAIIASCGGSDDDGGTADATLDSTAPTATEPAATDAPSDDAPASTVTSSDESSGDDAAPDDGSGGSGGSVDRDAIFSMSEREEFFAEPVMLTEETDDSLGQLVCTWESIEDPDDTEDLAFKLLVVQYYSGSPVPAAPFFDPDIYESVTTIEGVGDMAYSAGPLGMDFFFVDEPVGGALGYSEVDMGDYDAPKLHTPDDVEQLFRTFHDRVS